MDARNPGLPIWSIYMKMTPTFSRTQRAFPGVWWPIAGAALRSCSTIVSACSGFTSTRLRTDSILRLRPRQFLAVRQELRTMDPQGLGEFIACGCVLENRTLFREIYALPPGSAWSFRGGTLEKKAAYFEPREWEEQEPLDAEDYYAHLRDAFTTSLPRYFNGRERIGVSLTGGLDTRIIMAWRKAPPGSLPCYTFGSMYRENQDVYLARRVAGICGQPYQVVTVDGACLARLSALCGADSVSDRRMRGC